MLCDALKEFDSGYLGQSFDEHAREVRFRLFRVGPVGGATECSRGKHLPRVNPRSPQVSSE